MQPTVDNSFQNSIYNSKYFLNNKQLVIDESLKGHLILNKNLIYYKKFNFVVDKSQIENTSNMNCVKLISGGGSGHEPSHSGFVNDEFLTAAVSGQIFSSPFYINILKSIEVVHNHKGVLLIVKNYTGDIINFKLAMELASEKGIKVGMLIFDDDISFSIRNKKDSEEKCTNNFY